MLQKINDKEFIYHYTRLSIALENILSERKLLVNKISKLNDPKETRALSILESGWKEESEIHTLIKKCIVNEWRVVCFSCDRKYPDIRADSNPLDGVYKYHTRPGFARPTMWAHYAENHKGICFQFDKDKIENIIKRRYVEPNIILGDEVIYSSNIIMGLFPDLSKNYINEINNNGSKAIDEFIVNHMKFIFFRKLPAWEEEIEYRWVIKINDETVDEYIPIEDSLTSVIISINFPIVYLPSLIRLCKRIKVSIKMLRWYNGLPQSNNLKCIYDAK